MENIRAHFKLHYNVLVLIRTLTSCRFLSGHKTSNVHSLLSVVGCGLVSI